MASQPSCTKAEAAPKVPFWVTSAPAPMFTTLVVGTCHSTLPSRQLGIQEGPTMCLGLANEQAGKKNSEEVEALPSG